MAKTFSFKVIGHLLIALLISSLAGAADLSLNDRMSSYTNININTRSLPDLNKAVSVDSLKDKTAASEAAKLRTRKILEKLKMKSEGGVDSGSGGQGVYDMRTGQVRFADILSKEELQQMQLARYPEEHIFARFPKCTKSPYFMFSPSRLEEEVDSTHGIFHDLASSLGMFAGEFSNITLDRQVGMGWIVTPFHLRQLKDAKSISPDFQVQLAIYSHGTTYIQKQALDLMPVEDLKWLLVKEALRYEATRRKLNVDNYDIEEILRFLHQRNGPAVANTIYFLKLMRPKFEIDDIPDLIGKKKLIVMRLERRDLSFEERQLWESDLADIQFKEDRHYDDAQMPEHLKLDRAKMIADIEKAKKLGLTIASKTIYRGLMPGWALKFVGRDKEQTFIDLSPKDKEIPGFKGYNINTGEVELKLDNCLDGKTLIYNGPVAY